MDDYLSSRWDDTTAAQLSPVERLIYRSNLLGADPRLTNTGGGNTSSKLVMADPVCGDPIEVLWVKGSGGDLRTATVANFAALDMARVRELQAVYARYPERGVKTPAEDAMVGFYPHATFNRNPTAPSIDTPLHAFIPHAHVDHLHPVSVIALATAADGPALTREVYGDDVVWTPWQRPGFELGLELERICETHSAAKGVLLGGHGLINWADDDHECYELTLELIRRARTFLQGRRPAARRVFGGAMVAAASDQTRREVLTDVLPWLRGQLSSERKLLATVESSADVMAFVHSADAPRLAELGTSCPDHFLRTKIKPLYVPWTPGSGTVALKETLASELAQYRADYAAYYEACRRPNSPPMRGAAPTVLLVPGLGLIAWGKSKSESRVTAEFYTAAIGVMEGAERVSTYTALPRQEAFDIEYWLLEEAKLKRMPAERALDRQVVVVVGAGSGIGRAVVSALVAEGATVAAIDRDASAAHATAAQVLERVGMGIGAAGSGISASPQVIALGADMIDRASVRRAFENVVLAYGGIDHVVVTAGYYPTPDQHGQVADEEWPMTFGVNVTGPYIVADEAWRIWQRQGLSGSLVLTTSVNGVVAKTGSFAYDTSKAAANHLVRELAVAYAPLVRVNGVAPATVVEGSSMFPRERVVASLAKYRLPYEPAEDTDVLRERLAGFYAQRTLTKQPITLASQVQAILALVTNTFSRTTGQIVTVDGGLPEAFLR
jgi:rhamnulose-1-phosphate aldolase/alcohol dehydrogenase